MHNCLSKRTTRCWYRFSKLQILKERARQKGDTRGSLTNICCRAAFQRPMAIVWTQDGTEEGGMLDEHSKRKDGQLSNLYVPVIWWISMALELNNWDVTGFVPFHFVEVSPAKPEAPLSSWVEEPHIALSVKRSGLIQSSKSVIRVERNSYPAKMKSCCFGLWCKLWSRQDLYLEMKKATMPLQ